MSTAGTEAESKVISFAAFPNPATDVINIRYNLSTLNTITEIILYNSLGEEVSKKQLTSTSGTVSFDDQFINGVYFYSIKSDGEIVATKKIVLL